MTLEKARKLISPKRWGWNTDDKIFFRRVGDALWVDPNYGEVESLSGMVTRNRVNLLEAARVLIKGGDALLAEYVREGDGNL